MVRVGGPNPQTIRALTASDVVTIAPPSTLYQGTRTTTVGNAIPISDVSIPIKNSVVVQADLDNTGRILVGNASARPFELAAGDWVVIPIDNVQKVYFDVTVANERVNWLAS